MPCTENNGRYGCEIVNGAEDGTRTRNVQLGKLTLYH